ANAEAIQHLTQGLALLALLPETPARAQRELDLQIALGPAFMAIKGFGAPEVGLKSVLWDPGAVCHGAGAGGTALPAGSAGGHADAASGGPRRAGADLVPSGRICRGPDPRRAGDHAR